MINEKPDEAFSDLPFRAIQDGITAAMAVLRFRAGSTS